jgi:hypothetical protein
MRLVPPEEGSQVTRALVIGRGSVAREKIEIASAGWRPPSESNEGTELCIWIENLSDRAISLSCGPFAQQASNHIFCLRSTIESIGTDKTPKVQLDGVLTSNAKSVRVLFRRPKRAHRFYADVLLAHIAGDLQQSLKQDNPLNYFIIKVNGRVILHSLRFHVVGMSGQILAVTHGLSHKCLS